ncbi:MAG: hypothetical protein PHI31_09870 [Desulfuromonadaceae bacterium]|nr:hypothetical protein [Desulfuromonadaceae bacterium]
MIHTCKRTGIRETDQQQAEIKCLTCGFCEREAIREEFQNEKWEPTGIRDTKDQDD